MQREPELWLRKWNAAYYVKSVEVPRRLEDCLTPEQAEQVWDALDDSDFSDAIRFLIFTAGRPYEKRTCTATEVNRDGIDVSVRKPFPDSVPG